MGPVTTVKYRNYTKEGNPSWGSNDPPGCLDSWRVSTLCSRERSRRKARFKAGVNFNRYSSARQKKRRHGKRGVRGLKRWLKRMKTLVAAVGRYVALFSREPQINTPPPTPVTPSACHVPSRFLRRPFFLPPPPPPRRTGRDRIGGKIGLPHAQLAIFQRGRTSLPIRSSMKEFYGAEFLWNGKMSVIRSIGK